MSSNSRFVVLTGWHNIVHIALPLLPPPYFAPLSLAGLISTRSTSPFRAPFHLPFFFLLAFPILFLSPSLPQEFRSTGAFVMAMLSQLITVYMFSLLGLKLFNSGERVLELALVRIRDSPICPARLFYLMCEIIPAPQSAPLFVIPSRSGRLRPVLKSQFVSVLRYRLQSAGIPQAHLFRGHSFRRGGTSWAFACGIPGELIQVFGDWRSDAYKCYLDISLPVKLRVSQGMAFGLPTSKS